MPHLTLPHSFGDPVLEVWITASAPNAKLLKTAGKPVPNPVRARVLLDTFSGQRIDGLLGRDVLAACLLIYDGPGQSFTLSF